MDWRIDMDIDKLHEENARRIFVISPSSGVSENLKDFAKTQLYKSLYGGSTAVEFTRTGEVVERHLSVARHFDAVNSLVELEWRILLNYCYQDTLLFGGEFRSLQETVDNWATRGAAYHESLWTSDKPIKVLSSVSCGAMLSHCPAFRRSVALQFSQRPLTELLPRHPIDAIRQASPRSY